MGDRAKEQLKLSIEETMEFGRRTVLYGISQAMYPDKSIYFKEPTKGFLNAKNQMKLAAEVLLEYDKRAVLSVVNNALFGEKIDKEATDTKDHENFSDNKDRNAKVDDDMNTEKDKDINIRENEDIDTEENKDIDTEENEDYDTIPHKLTAGSEADSNMGSDKSSTPAKPKQNASPINAGALTKVAKSNTASEYITSIDKLADLVNQSSPSKLDTPAKGRINQKAVTLKRGGGRSPATSKISSSGTDKGRKPRLVGNQSGRVGA